MGLVIRNVLSVMYYVLRFCCSAVRAGRGIGTPLAERDRYNGTILHAGVQIVQNVCSPQLRVLKARQARQVES